MAFDGDENGRGAPTGNPDGAMEDEKKHPHAMETALRLLAHREHTRDELKRKLIQRGMGESVVKAVLAHCERRGYIDDTRSAKTYVQERSRKGYGSHRIRHELKRKGIDPEKIEKALAQGASPAADLEAAIRAFEKKRYRFEGEPDARKRRAAIHRYLYARGFSGETIAGVIQRMELG